VLQRVAVCCSVLQCVSTSTSVVTAYYSWLRKGTMNQVSVKPLQCVAVSCSMLQCVAVCCSMLHCAALCCAVLQYAFQVSFRKKTQWLPCGKCNTDVRVAVCCSVLQRAAVCCSVLQCVAVCFPGLFSQKNPLTFAKKPYNQWTTCQKCKTVVRVAVCIAVCCSVHCVCRFV